MNPDPFTDYIERVVGPVRAIGVRKDRMREELAAHLAASWQEERVRKDDDRAAAERAIRRLGDVAELSRSLQDSVPRLERWLFTPLATLAWLDAIDRVMRRREGETLCHHAFRVTIGITAAIAAAELIVVPVSVATRASLASHWSTRLVWAVASLVVIAAGAIVFTLLAGATIHAFETGKRGRLRVAGYLALSSLVALALGLLFVLIVSLDSHRQFLFARSDWLRLLAGSLFAPRCWLAALASPSRGEDGGTHGESPTLHLDQNGFHRPRRRCVP